MSQRHHGLVLIYDARKSVKVGRALETVTVASFVCYLHISPHPLAQMYILVFPCKQYFHLVAQKASTLIFRMSDVFNSSFKFRPRAVRKIGASHDKLEKLNCFVLCSVFAISVVMALEMGLQRADH